MLIKLLFKTQTWMFWNGFQRKKQFRNNEPPPHFALMGIYGRIYSFF